MEFKAQPRTIRDALDLKRKYIIPRFQREYSWEQEELTELWDDLLDNLTYDRNKLVASEYFIGSLVLVGDDDDTHNIDRQVVDGQQRLMTFTIAFSVLSQLFKKIGETKLGELAYGYVVGEDEDGNPYSKVVSETPKPFFQYRIQQKEVDYSRQPKTDEEKRILAAAEFFESKLAEKGLLNEIKTKFPGTNVSYTDALKLFRDQILKCKVIYVTVKDFEEAYTIFEVLNAKGKDLTSVDVIKNTLFSVLDQTEPIDVAYDKWGNIRKQIAEGAADGIMTFYRHFWLSKYSFATNKKLVDEFNKKVEKTQACYQEFLNELEKASEDYARIALPRTEYWTQPEDRVIYETLEALNIFGVTQVRIFLLALFDSRRKKMVSHKELVKILNYLQYYHFVFNAVCSKSSSGLERRYSSYARKLRASSNKAESAQCVHELIDALKQSLPTFEEFRIAFHKLRFTSSLTKDKKLIQYILKKQERYLAGTNEMKPDSFSIEHILPESVKFDYVGKVGNLLPLGVELNSELENKPLPEKKIGYRRSRYETAVQFTEEYADINEWTEDMIELRTDVVAKKLYEAV